MPERVCWRKGSGTESEWWEFRLAALDGDDLWEREVVERRQSETVDVLKDETPAVRVRGCATREAPTVDRDDNAVDVSSAVDNRGDDKVHDLVVVVDEVIMGPKPHSHAALGRVLLSGSYEWNRVGAI